MRAAAQLWFVVAATAIAVPAAAAEETLTVALVSPRCAFGDVEGNLAHFAEFAKEAKAKGARLVCFPELALVSYSTEKEVLQYAEPVPGETTAAMEKIARELGVFLSVGMAEREGEEFFITQVLVGPEGYLGKYRKSYPTQGEQSCGFSPGEEYPTWEVDGFRMGILICADGRRPETIEAMKSRHVDVIHHPHGNAVSERLGREAEEWTRAKTVYFAPRATQARTHILVNNSAEDTKQPGGVVEYSSGALAIDPLGQVIGRTDAANREEKMILVELEKPEALIPPGELGGLRRSDEVFGERFGK
jgi:predicted amidohydrolase